MNTITSANTRTNPAKATLFIHRFETKFLETDLGLQVRPWLVLISPARLSIKELLREITNEAARAAADAWPQLLNLRPHLWQERADRLVRAGKLPLPSGFSRNEHIRRLASLNWRRPLISILGCEEPTPAEAREDRVSTLARAGEWLSSQISAPVILAFPRSWTPLQDERFFRGWAPSGTVSIVDWSVGRPHHFSSSEQRLAAVINEDGELRKLFAFNKTIRTKSGATPKVDLLWSEGQLAIEVDGFQLHGGETAFRSDRQRDFELIAAGYTVLRVTDDEIFQDVGRVVEKIRTLVMLRRKNIDSGA